MTPRCPISILIPAKNERANLRACLESCRFADEVVVVDSVSTDGTAEIAAEFGATIVEFQWDGAFPKKKNWALAHVPWRHEWVFILDADERITPQLAAELATLAASPPPGIDGYYVNRRFWFLDGWLLHCGYYPSWNLRFFRHRLGRYEQFDGVTMRFTSMWSCRAAPAACTAKWSITLSRPSISGSRNITGTRTGRPVCSPHPPVRPPPEPSSIRPWPASVA